MKRYWKLISIAVVVLLTIGAYYIQSALTGNEYPEFVFEHKSGNEEEVKNLTLDAQYSNNFQHDRMQITAEGSKYQGEQSYVEGLNRYVDTNVKQLQEDYRSFMRGKSERSLRSFYENDTMLLYVTHDDFTFDIEMLEKDSGDRTAFSIDIPETEDYHMMQIGGVQVIDGEIKIITRNYSNIDQTGYTSSEEIHVYNLDIDNQEITNNEIIHSNAEQNNADVAYSTIINEHADMDENEYLLVDFDHMKNVEHENGVPNLEPIENELIAYNLETIEQEELELPVELQDSIHTAFLSGSKIYFNTLTENGIEISTIDLKSKELETVKVLEEPEAFEVEPHMAIKDDKVYLTSTSKDSDTEATIFVVDVNAGDILYEGSVEIKDREAAKEDYVLNIHEMNIE